MHKKEKEKFLEFMSMELEERIEKAKTLKVLNSMRLEVVESKSTEILKLWQDKFWEMKKCRTCGLIKK